MARKRKSTILSTSNSTSVETRFLNMPIPEVENQWYEINDVGYTSFGVQYKDAQNNREIKDIDGMTSEYHPDEPATIVQGNVDWKVIGTVQKTKSSKTELSSVTVLEPYQLFESKQKGNVFNFKSNTNYYDFETHKYLGEYLRAYKGNYDVNLLPFYNCFSLNGTDDFWINPQTNEVEETYTDTGYFVYLIPVKYDKEYTIAMEPVSSVYLTPVLANSLGRIKSSIYKKDIGQNEDGEQQEILEPEYIDKNLINIQRVDDISFHKPFIWQVSLLDYYLQDNPLDTEIEALYHQEDNLYLLLQVPKQETTSIVVLEGNFKSNVRNSLNYITSQDSSVQSDDVDLFSALSLLQMNTKSDILPFSNRLIEYLLLNVINSQEEIGRNILRVQQDTEFPTTRLTRGVWENLLQVDLFQKYMNYKKDPLYYKWDITGFVDKDVERFITRGKGV